MQSYTYDISLNKHAISSIFLSYFRDTDVIKNNRLSAYAVKKSVSVAKVSGILAARQTYGPE